jgi:hypothetical protein
MYYSSVPNSLTSRPSTAVHHNTFLKAYACFDPHDRSAAGEADDLHPATPEIQTPSWGHKVACST